MTNMNDLNDPFVGERLVDDPCAGRSSFDCWDNSSPNIKDLPVLVVLDVVVNFTTFIPDPADDTFHEWFLDGISFVTGVTGPDGGENPHTNLPNHSCLDLSEGNDMKTKSIIAIFVIPKVCVATRQNRHECGHFLLFSCVMSIVTAVDSATASATTAQQFAIIILEVVVVRDCDILRWWWKNKATGVLFGSSMGTCWFSEFERVDFFPTCTKQPTAEATPINLSSKVLVRIKCWLEFFRYDVTFPNKDRLSKVARG